MSACIFDVKYTIGGTVTGLRGSGLVLQNSSGKYLSVAANGGFTFASGVAHDSTYSVTVRTQPTNPAQTCSVVNATGTIAKAAVTNVIVHCSRAGRYVYVANQTSDTISAFVIETTGALATISGSPYTANGTTPTALVVDPNGAFVYVVNNGSNEITAYAIDDATGELTQADVEIATGNAPVAATIDPTGRFLYVANQTDGTVSALSIDSGTDLASAITGSPYAVGLQPGSLRTDPTGAHLYVTNFGDGTVTAFAIDFSTGQLSLISGSPFGAGAGANAIAIAPAGTFAYVANPSAASISGFSVTAASGILAAVSGSPVSVAANPESVVVDPTGLFLYAANAASPNAIATYTITPSTGSLTLTSSVAAGTLPASIAVDPSGSFLYAANMNSADISVYSVNSGALTAVTGSPFAAGSGPRSIVVD